MSNHDELDLEAMAIYAVEFNRCMRAGDDALNARLRIIELGCPAEVAEVIEEEFDIDADSNDADSNDADSNDADADDASKS